MHSTTRYEISLLRKCNVCVALETQNKQANEDKLPLSKAFSCSERVYEITPPSSPKNEKISKKKNKKRKKTMLLDIKQSVGECTGCHLIYYCNQQHQKIDWPKHSEFCNIVQKIMAHLKVEHPLMIAGGEPKSQKDIDNAIYRLKFLLRAGLGRPLTYQEEELTSFPAYCAHCFTLRSLKHCPDCKVVAYCSDEHYELDQDNHKDWCFVLKIYYSQFKAWPPSIAAVKEYTKVESMRTMNLLTFIGTVTHLNAPVQPSVSYEKYQCFLSVSDYSCIGTVLYAMEYLAMAVYPHKRFVLFVVGATVEHELWFREQHLRLFFLQNPLITKLHIDFIGPEVSDGRTSIYQLPYMDKTRHIELRSYRMRFEEFVATHKDQPSMIIAFNCGFSQFANYDMDIRKDDYTAGSALANGRDKKSNDQPLPISENANCIPTTKDFLTPGVVVEPDSSMKNNPWRLGILAMLETYNVPIVFTSFTYMEAQYDYATVVQVADSDRIPMRVQRFMNCHRNPYAECRPMRKWNYYDKEQFFFRNHYIQGIRSSYG